MNCTKEVRAARVQATNEAKEKLSRALNDAGLQTNPFESVSSLRTKARQVFGPALPGEDAIEYFSRVSYLRPRIQRAASGQIATPRTQPKFVPLVVKPHPREAELLAMPRPVSMPWDGAGVFWRQEY